MNFTLSSKAKGVLRIGGYVTLFFLSFLFFLYATFPYGVLKETISTHVAQGVGMDLRIGSLGPAFPIGLSAADVRLGHPDIESTIPLKQVTVKVSPLGLLAGQIGISVYVQAAKDGELDMTLDLPISKIVAGTLTMPSSLELEANEFPLDASVRFAMDLLAASPNTNPLVGPLLGKIGFKGRLNASVDIAGADVNRSKGKADISLKDSVLKLDDPSLNLADQKFTKASLKATLDNGNFVVANDSGLTSSELEIGVDGSVKLKADVMASDTAMNVKVKLNAGLREQFGFIMDAVLGGGSGGEYSLQLRGPLGAPAMTKF